MAGTATHLHTVPTPAPVLVPRGNHPAGRALRARGPRTGSAGAPLASTAGGGEGAVRLAPVRQPLADVVPLHPRRASADGALAGRARVDGARTDGARGDGARGEGARIDGARGDGARIDERPSGPVRLTRRGRRVVAGLGVGVVVAVSAVVGAAVLDGAGSPALELAGRSTVTVHSGDTLWSIAVALAPDTDPREVVDALQEANGLTGASLVPGQVLLVP